MFRGLSSAGYVIEAGYLFSINTTLSSQVLDPGESTAEKVVNNPEHKMISPHLILSI